MKIKSVDSQTERHILIGLITNDSFCKQIIPILRMECFSADYAKRIAEWCSDYYKKYKKPIDSEITSVFNRESQNIQQDEKELVEALLLSISEEWDEDAHFNTGYWVDRAIEFIKARSLEFTADRVKKNLELGRVVDAERELLGYNQVAKETSKISSLIEVDSVIDRVFSKEETEMFTPDGDLGKVLGPIRRRGLMGIFGASKISKTFVAFDLALEAAKKGFKVCIASIEMSRSECEERLLLQILNRPYDEDKVESLYTTWDCKHHRDNSCRRRERVNRNKYQERDGSISENYTPCDVCRGVNNDYSIEFFDRMEERPLVTPAYAKSRVKKGLKYEGLKNIRITAFPQFSAPWGSVEQTLDYLQNVDNFQADILVIDYINILKATSFRDKRNNIDELWQSAKRCADERNICIISPIHANRSGYNDVYLDMTHLSESIGIAQTCTNILAIDTEKDLKAHNVVRAHQIANRFDQFNPKDCVYMLQNLNHGKVCYDSWFYSYRDHLNFGFKNEKKKK